MFKSDIQLPADTAGFRRYDAGTAGIFLVRNKGVKRTGLLAGTVYFGHIGRYGTESITLILPVFL